ncbi:MAG: D-amino-acid transaminase [Rhodospirillales bacterium]|nr:D-amino-acid transaminase [Rhodospirillales bacterium]
MGTIAYVDGRYVPHGRALVHVEDRGYQFADAVYEVIGIHRGRPVDEAEHLERLGRSLAAARIDWPVAEKALRIKIVEMIRRNRITSRGMVYIQISRGVAPRNHIFPPSCHPVLVMTAKALPSFDWSAACRGVAVITTADLRWRRCDIKSTSLIANVLARQDAHEAGAFEAWLVEGDVVTEGTASNAWIVTHDGLLRTHNADNAILNGITRRAVMHLAAEHGLSLREGAFTLSEAKAAAEAFLTSTTSMVKPVVRIDDAVIGDGAIGPLSRRLLAYYVEHVGEPGH